LKSHLHIYQDSKTLRSLNYIQTRILKKMLGLVISILAILIIGLSLFFYLELYEILWVSTLGSCVLLLFFFRFLYKYKLLKSKAQKLYLLQLNYPDILYHEEQYISEDEFRSSILYDDVVLKYSGSDYLKHSNWSASNIDIQTSASKDEEERIPVFNGCMMIVDTHQEETFNLIIKPKQYSEKLKLPSFLIPLISPFFHPIIDRIILDENHFNDFFNAYSDQVDLAKDFLTSERMHRILNLNYLLTHLFEKQKARNKSRIFKSPFNQAANSLELSIQNGRLYFAIKGQQLFSLASEKEEDDKDSYLLRIINEILVIAN